MSGDIRFERRAHVGLCYDVLSHVDLGRDAGTLFDPTTPARAWTAGLREAYLAAPGRLAVQAIALVAADEHDLRARLSDRPPRLLADAPGRALGRALLAAMEAERDEFSTDFAAAAAEANRRRRELERTTAPALARLRDALYERQGTPPELLVVHAAALRRHARAATVDGRRIVAADLTQPTDQLLCQILHEEVHPLTDPLVLAASPGVRRDTRPDSPGYVLHQAIERTALDVGAAVIEARAPELAPAYCRWRAGFRL